jgi:hypothetical protein
MKKHKYLKRPKVVGKIDWHFFPYIQKFREQNGIEFLDDSQLIQFLLDIKHSLSDKIYEET